MVIWIEERKQIFEHVLQFELSMLVHNPFYDLATSNLKFCKFCLRYAHLMNKSNRILLNWLKSSACGYDRAHVVMIERMAPISGHV